MASDMLRLRVCWNHMDGVAVWYVSPYVSVDISFQMALTLCSNHCGEAAANLNALYAYSLVVEMSDVFSQGGLLGGNMVSGSPRNSWAVYPNRPRWSMVMGISA